jgi:hypothetical protein
MFGLNNDFASSEQDSPMETRRSAHPENFENPTSAFSYLDSTPLDSKRIQSSDFHESASYPTDLEQILDIEDQRDRVEYEELEQIDPSEIHPGYDNYAADPDPQDLDAASYHYSQSPHPDDNIFFDELSASRYSWTSDQQRESAQDWTDGWGLPSPVRVIHDTE